MKFRSSEEARAARVLACITFHFDASRLGLLTDAIISLAHFVVASVNVMIVTNASDRTEVALLRRLCCEALAGEHAEIRSYPDLKHPFDLTWCHKEIIAGEFCSDGSPYTHFIYIEDDIRLTFANFVYFVEARRALRPLGLLPGFVRTEFSKREGELVASDAFWPVYVPAQPYCHVADLVFLNMPNPYNPCFILDRELASEHAHSPSFDPMTSQTLCCWGVRERAAMGLCMQNVPGGFQSRYVIPVAVQARTPPAFAQIRHLSTNYADNIRSPLGKVRLDRLLIGSDELSITCGSRPRWALDIAARHLPGGGAAYFLATDHDTILYFHAGRLEHAPFGIAPLNLLVATDVDDDRMRLISATALASGPLSFTSSDGSVVIEEAGPSANYSIAWIDQGRLSIATDTGYLGADYDGRARNNRQWCRAWEQYRAIRCDTLQAVALLRLHCWIDQADRQVVTMSDQPLSLGREPSAESSALAATISTQALEERRWLSFGKARIRLTGMEQSIINHGSPSEVGWSREVEIIGGDGSTRRFCRLLEYSMLTTPMV